MLRYILEDLSSLTHFTVFPSSILPFMTMSLLIFISCSDVLFANAISCSHTQNVWNITRIWHTKWIIFGKWSVVKWRKYGLMNHYIFLQKWSSVKAHLLSKLCLFKITTRHCNDHTKFYMWQLELLQLDIQFTSSHSTFHIVIKFHMYLPQTRMCMFHNVPNYHFLNSTALYLNFVGQKVLCGQFLYYCM